MHRKFQKNIEEKDNKLVITFKGDGFLRYQVRNMVGILIKIGENKYMNGSIKASNIFQVKIGREDASVN